MSGFMSQTALATELENSPFHLHNNEGYGRWRAQKLQQRVQDAADLLVSIDDITQPGADEVAALREKIRANNMVIYRTARQVDKTALRRFGQHMGLEHLDGNLCADEDSITSLQVVNEGRHAGYIPYSNRPLSWHTDGYYNESKHQIRAILMHCAMDAAEGGDNALLDHELIYMQLRDEDPQMIAALMQADAMTIPGNNEGGEEIRGAEAGPVFSLDSHGNLHMRYSARQRNIIWKDDAMVEKARQRILQLLQDDNEFIVRYRLSPGEGVLCNNVLHNRSGFSDDTESGKKRLLYRARYYDRVANTDVTYLAGE
jgi:alpha-ketoglutarate-dependent taurine dioxygenase